MGKQLLALAVLTTVLVAAAPGPSPVITLEGVSEAVELSPELRAALAPRVTALNATLEKIVALQADAPKATEERRAHMHEAMKGIHEIINQLDPEQRAAFHEYLHAQMKAAGIQMTHPPHGDRAHPPHGERPHPPHGQGAHPRHGQMHGDPVAAAA